MKENYVELVGDVVFVRLYDGKKVAFQSVIIKVAEKVGKEIYYSHIVCKAFGNVTQPKIEKGMTIGVYGKLKTEKQGEEFKTVVIASKFISNTTTTPAVSREELPF